MWAFFYPCQGDCRKKHAIDDIIAHTLGLRNGNDNAQSLFFHRPLRERIEIFYLSILIFTKKPCEILL